MAQRTRFNGALIVLIFYCAFGNLALPLMAQQSQRAKSTHSLQGILINSTPNLSLISDILAKDGGGSLQNIEGAVRAAYAMAEPMKDTEITLIGRNGSLASCTDATGAFSFDQINEDIYKIVVRGKDERSTFAIASGPSILDSHRFSNSTITLCVREDALSIKGMVVDSNGHPIPNAVVRAIPYPMPETDDVTSVFHEVKSKADGSFEITHIFPSNIRKVMGYLRGGNPMESGKFPFFVQLQASAVGFVQNKNSIPQVPLISENLLILAKQINSSVARFQTESLKNKNPLKDPNVTYPRIVNSTINDVRVVLEKQH